MNRDQFVNSYGQPVDWLIATARRNPEAFLVLAAGAALLMRGRGSSPNRAPDYRQMRNWQGNGGRNEAIGTGTADNIRQSSGEYAAMASDTTNRVAGAASEVCIGCVGRGAFVCFDSGGLCHQAGQGVRRTHRDWLIKRRAWQAKPNRRFNPVQGP